MEAFQTAKKMLTSDCVLAHNDPTKDILLAYDAEMGLFFLLSTKMVWRS